MKMDRRNFIKATGLSLAAALMHDSLFSSSKVLRGQLINYPDTVSAIINGQTVRLAGAGKETWTYQDLLVGLEDTGTGIAISIQAPHVRLSSVTLSWKTPSKSSSLILDDHWERTYGDVSWHKPRDVQILPWYFMEFDGRSANGFGVKTGAQSFCSWQVCEGELNLTLDTHSGGNGVQLAGRKLQAAEIVTVQGTFDESPFQTARRFAQTMCDKSRMPQQPVYGINDWYFSYGNNSEKLILEHTAMMAPMADGLSNRPFSVIDAGWFQDSPALPNDCCWGDTMSRPNEKFGDMGLLADQIKKAGMRPGLWTRPLCGSSKDSHSLMLPLIKGREQNRPVLDPTIPENLERVGNYFKMYKQWGYELIKFDFTSFDIFGKWGFEMLKDRCMTASNWSMNDASLTNAEIILNLYQTIRRSAGATYILSCNTFSHLAAGIFELNRIGDDTSGNEWDRTRTMGVNTLAFRGLQHGAFYAADPDCIGLTPKIPWDKNKQWMELVAKSGTPLFISAQSEATGEPQRIKIKECFKAASQNLPLGEPLDWMETAVPKRWKLNDNIENFNWN
jgi:alpha-galactosidase